MDKRESHLKYTAEQEAKTKKAFANEKKPYPDGNKFAQLFNKEADARHLPYMRSYSLNSDVVLYRAMLIILSKRLGMLEERVNEDSQQDTVSNSTLSLTLNQLKTVVANTEDFLSSKAMKSLRDNEFDHYHENKARLTCYNFLRND